MRRLGGMDAMFLSMERPAWALHTGAVAIVDPSGVPGFGFEKLRDFIDGRLHAVPELTSRLRDVPLGLGRPYLVPDDEFDLGNHLHRVSVPPPGTPHQLADVLAGLLVDRLDRSRPLWEMWYLDGLEGGRVGMFTKMHHALADGVSGMGLATVLCDVSPEPSELPPLAGAPDAAGALPGDVELAAKALVELATAPIRLARWAPGALAHYARALPSLVRSGASAPTVAPRTPWNGVVGTGRAVAYTSVPLDEVKAVRRATGVKVNDVILALCADALRHYLLVHDALPRRRIAAAVPVSARTESATSLGNQVLATVASLETNVADPAARLRAIAAGMAAGKQRARVIRAGDLDVVIETLPPAMTSAFFWSVRAARLEAVLPMPSNLIISNIPGPPFQLYTAGAPIVGMYAVPIIAFGQGVNITVMSYMNSLEFGLTVDRDLIPDPWVITDRLPVALAELDAAVLPPDDRARQEVRRVVHVRR